MKISISRGNLKLGNIPSISLPPVISCPPRVPCSILCYALKAYRNHHNTKTAYDRNLEILRLNPGVYFRQIMDYLSNRRPKYFRFHVSGDFISAAHLDSTIELIKDFPKTRFLAFTKNHDILPRLSTLPKNLSLIPSLWPGWGKRPKGYRVAFMRDGNETRANNAIECPGSCADCKACWNIRSLRRDVVFGKH
jgi:hypothetical protein